MPGCPACEDHLPRLLRQIEGYQRFGHPFVIYELGYQLQPGEIPVFIYDATSKDPSVQAFADQHKVSGVPCTLVLPKYGYGTKHEGSMSDRQIYDLLNGIVARNR